MLQWKIKLSILWKLHHASNIIASDNWHLLSENLFKYTGYIYVFNNKAFWSEISNGKLIFLAIWPLLTPLLSFCLTWVMTFGLIHLSYIFTLLSSFWFLNPIQNHHNITLPPPCIHKATTKCYFTLYVNYTTTTRSMLDFTFLSSKLVL